MRLARVDFAGGHRGVDDSRIPGEEKISYPK